MNKNEVITKLARSRTVENLISQWKLKTPYATDLCQDIYLSIAAKPESEIVGMFERGEIVFYIRKMIANNVNSVTSPFYSNYEKYRKKSTDIENIGE